MKPPDGLWNTAKNWSTNKVPTEFDDVTIGAFTVTANGDTDFANTLTCTGTLILNANMNITSTSSFTNLTLTLNIAVFKPFSVGVRSNQVSETCWIGLRLGRSAQPFRAKPS